MVETVLIVFALLIVKHFLVDFPLQKPYQWMNKGTYGHPGGILHACLHGLFTFIALVCFTPMAISLACLDTIIHYNIDWAKMNINAHYGWKADKDEAFWVLLGLDQLLHYLTYVLIIWLAFL